MEKIRLYHGSPHEIRSPQFHFGNPKNDYGYGFYCTENSELAKEWGVSEENDGFANEYLLDLDGLTILNLASDEYNILNWLSILVENRTFELSSSIARTAKSYLLQNFPVPYHAYDIIAGYRADDSYFSFANAFLNNTISLQKLNRAMYLGKLGEQIVIKSKKAFSQLSFVKSSVAERNTYYPKKMLRDTTARKTFFEMRSESEITDSTSIFVMDLIRQGSFPRKPASLQVFLGTDFSPSEKSAIRAIRGTPLPRRSIGKNMATHAYQQFYLTDAQQNLAVMFDYALRSLKYEPNQFFLYFIHSGVAEKFGHANPKYIVGMSGIDLCEHVLQKVGEHIPSVPQDFLVEEGAEFWLGWALAYYQWYSGLRFADLQEYGLVPSEILSRYILHEADISKFVSVANKIILKNKLASPTHLQTLRKSRGFTQAELAELSGVSLRMIQLYEQRQNDINKAAGEVINALAKALCCNFYEVMEIKLNE